MRFLGKFRFWGRNPLTIVEIAIGIFSMVGGLYVVSPLLSYSVAINGASPIIALLSHPFAIIGYGLLFIISGALIIAGVIKRRYTLRSWGLFLNILLRIYSLIGTFLLQGFLPLTWLNSFLVLIIALICWVAVRGFIVRGFHP